MLEIIETDDFRKWRKSLQDLKVRSAVQRRIATIQAYERFIGDFKPVGNGVVEIRIHISPGYRIYAAIKGKRVMLLLNGGTKRRQKQDIEKAKTILREWRAQ